MDEDFGLQWNNRKTTDLTPGGLDSGFCPFKSNIIGSLSFLAHMWDPALWGRTPEIKSTVLKFMFFSEIIELLLKGSNLTPGGLDSGVCPCKSNLQWDLTECLVAFLLVPEGRSCKSTGNASLACNLMVIKATKASHQSDSWPPQWW